MSVKSLFFCSFFGIAQFAFADVIVVTAPQNPGNWQVQDVGSIQSATIDRDSFENSFHDLGDVLQEQAGVNVNQRGGLGSLNTVSIRGASSQQTPIFLDGIPLSTAGAGTFDLSWVNINDLASIEVYKGNTPVSFGDSGLGGAINLTTSHLPQHSAYAGIGSFDSRKLAFLSSDSFKNFRYSVSGSHIASDNDFTFYDDEVWEEHFERHNAAYEQNSGLASFSYLPNSQSELTISHLSSDTRQEIPHSIFDLDITNDAEYNSRMSKSSISFRQQALAVRGYIGKLDTLYTQSSNNHGRLASHTKQQNDSYGADIQYQKSIEQHSLQLDGRYFYEEFASDDRSKNSRSVLDTDADMAKFQLGVSDHIELSKRLGIYPGLRYTNLDLSAPNETQQEQHWNPQLGASYQLRPAILLTSNMARYSRAPTLIERFGMGSVVRGNDELQTEKSRNIDVGLQYQAGSTSMASSLYYRQLTHRIGITYDSRGIGRYINIGDVDVAGFEFSGSSDLAELIDVSWAITFVDATTASSNAAFDNKALPLQPEWETFLEISLVRPQWRLGLNHHYNNGFYLDSANLDSVDTQHLLGLTAQYRWDGLRLDLEVENLLDSDLKEYNGHPLPGRSAFVSLKYDF